MLFGVDNNLLQRALDGDVFRGVRPARRSRTSTPRSSSTPSIARLRSTAATCASTTTRRGSRATGWRRRDALPTSTLLRYRGLLSSRIPRPRRRASRSCWRRSRSSASGWQDYWRKLARERRAQSWTAGRTPTTRRFSGAAGSKGKRPVVVSYALEPARGGDLPRAEYRPTRPPVSWRATCFRQIELRRSAARERGTRRAPASSSTSCSRSASRRTSLCRCSCFPARSDAALPPEF